MLRCIPNSNPINQLLHTQKVKHFIHRNGCWNDPCIEKVIVDFWCQCMSFIRRDKSYSIMFRRGWVCFNNGRACACITKRIYIMRTKLDDERSRLTFFFNSEKGKFETKQKYEQHIFKVN